MKRKIRVGSRDSRLAVVQTQIVMDKIRQYDSTIELELVTMKTTGDKILHKTLDKIGGKGLFVKELEQGLLNGEIDICVHSLKDMEVNDHPELPVVAFGDRENPFDALVLPQGKGHLDYELPAGSSSGRRACQLRVLYPGITVDPIRGNVITRLDKLDRGDFSALVLAEAGLLRLGLNQRITRRFTAEEMVPAACQGILAVQSRRGHDTDYLSLFVNENSTIAAQCERMFIKTLDCGCGAPVGVYCQVHQNEIHVSGMYYDDESGVIYKKSMAGDKASAWKLGEKLAVEILADMKRGR